MPVPSKESARARKLKRVKEENPELYEQAVLAYFYQFLFW